MRHNAPTRALLEQEAELRARLTKYSELAAKTGYSEQYIANFIGRLVRAKRRNGSTKVVVDFAAEKIS